MKYKLICSDHDDTLLNSSGRVPRGLKDSIARYVDRGGKFCIVTGRMTVGALPICRELDLFGEVITFQGAVVADISSGNVINEVTIPCADAVEVGRYLESKGVYYQTYVGKVFITAKATDYTKLYGKISIAEYVETGIPLSEYIKNNELNLPKMLIMDDKEKIAPILQDLRNKFGDKFLINTSKPFIIEIVPKGIDKGAAVAALAKKYNIKREEVICVGDSENDLPMIEYAGLGVAVDNASNYVKSRADLVVPSCDDHGLEYVIDKYGR